MPLLSSFPQTLTPLPQKNAAAHFLPLCSCCDPVLVLTAIYKVERSPQFPGVKSYYCHERLEDTFQQSVKKEKFPSVSLHLKNTNRER